VAVSPAGATADQIDSIGRAIDMWSVRGVTGLVLDADGAAPAIALEFRDAAPTFHGYYDPDLGAVYINVDLVDPDQRAVTIAHELGHAFGLAHVARDVRSAVMNPDHLSIAPTGDDEAALDAIWGACH